MTARRVVLLRHGRTAQNLAGIWQGRMDTDLDDVGRRQAEEVALVLAADIATSTAGGLGPVRLVSSDLRRARDTAAPLARHTGLPVVEDSELREVDGGTWEGLTREEIVARGMGDQLDAWRRGEDVRVGGAETRSEAALRGAVAIVKHAEQQDGGLLVVIGHGGVLRGATLSLLGLPPADWMIFAGLDNCRWAELVPGADRWRLVTYNVGAGAVPAAGSQVAL